MAQSPSAAGRPNTLPNILPNILPNTLPNILFVMTDEERARKWWPDSVTLPHRARLAARGVTFTQHHVHSMPCTPSRSNIFTGQHTQVTQMFDNINFPPQPSMSTSIPTIGTMLRSAGYTTAYHGKWHLSRDDDLAAMDGLEPYGFSAWEGPDNHGRPYEGERVDRSAAQKAAAWITEHGRDADPWMCVVSFVNPHDIMLYPRFRRHHVRDWGVSAPDNAAIDIATRPEVHRRWRATCDALAGRVKSSATWSMLANAYIDLTLMADRQFGVVLDALEASGARDNTIVIFTSDHGDLAGAHGQRQKGAFVHAEITHVPLVVADPRVPATAGTTCNALTGALDLVPTMLEWAGVQPASAVGSGLPGRSFADLVTDPDRAGDRSNVVFAHDAGSSLGLLGPCRGFMRGLYDGRYRFGRYFDRGQQHAPLAECDVELYDTAEDPAELHNLAHSPNSAARALISDLDALCRDLVAGEIGADDIVPEAGEGLPLWARGAQMLAERALQHPSAVWSRA